MPSENKEILPRIKAVLQAHPELFPVPNALQQLEGLPSYEVLRSGINRKEWERMQVDWVRSVSQEHFLAGFAGKMFSNVPRFYGSVDAEISSRLQKITAQVAKKYRTLFPNPFSLEHKDGLPTDATLGARVAPEIWQAMQIKWVSSSSQAVFLASISGQNMRIASKPVYDTISDKLQAIIRKKLEKNKSVFPTPKAVSRFSGMPEEITISSRIPAEKWEEWQLEWIAVSSDEDFIAEFHSKRFARVSDSVKERKKGRLRSMLVGKLSSGIIPQEAVAALGNWDVIKRNIPDFDELVGISQCILQRTDDQAIVSSIGLSYSGREQWVNELIEGRMEQLWFFRELFALAKTGNADGATVISFFHPSLPKRLESLLPGVTVGHVLLEDLENGPLPLGGKSILLSVFQWLSPKRTAQLIRNLSLSVPEGAEVIFTYPAAHLINPDSLGALATAGFSLEKVGQLSISPLGVGGATGKKLGQVSGLAMLRRHGSSSEIRELALFVRGRQGAPEREGTEYFGSTYSPEELRAAGASVVLHEASAQVKQNGRRIPPIQIIAIDIGTDGKALLTFLSGSIAGFNMDPRRPGMAELEGMKILQSTLNAVSAIARGSPAEVNVGEELSGKYREFLATVRPSAWLAVRTVPKKANEK